MRFSVKADIDSMLDDLNVVQRQAAPRATQRALNAAGRKAETLVVAHMADALKVPKAHVRWRHDQAGNRTSKRRLIRRNAKRGSLAVLFDWLPRRKGARGTAGPNIKLITLGAKQVGRSGRRKVGGGQGGVIAKSHFVPSGFIRRPARGGGRQVFKRQGQARYPILVQTLPILPEGDRAFSLAFRAVRALFLREFSRQMDLELQRTQRTSRQRALRDIRQGSASLLPAP